MHRAITKSTEPNQIHRLALLGDHLATWTGGIDFLRICVSALSSVSPGTSWNIVLQSKRVPKYMVALAKNGIKKLLGMKTVPLADHRRRALTNALKSSGARIRIVYYDSPSDLPNAMRRCRTESLFPCQFSLGRSFPYPWIGYIPDLQHKRFPQWFSEVECSARNEQFSRILAEAPAVVVNAAAVVSDIEEFYPNTRAKVFSLPYCPLGNQPEFSAAERLAVRKAYGLPKRYFIVSNQFWIHKSHETAFRALRLVRDAGHDVGLVCTGATTDYRWPEYFENLRAVIEGIELRDHIQIVGLVPKSDQLTMMCESVAVIQPTLFEGGPGGGSVYDATSLNKACIVSNIPVNKEIDIGVVRFFAAGSAEDLAMKMIGMLENPPEMPRRDDLAARLRIRRLEFARVLVEAADWASGKVLR
jgi:glycosyltransferase involved in cell wall biosynthesis